MFFDGLSHEQGRSHPRHRSPVRSLSYGGANGGRGGNSPPSGRIEGAALPPLREWRPWRFQLKIRSPTSYARSSTPSAARIDQIRTQIAESGAVCAFPEYAHDAGLITTVTEGSDIRTGDELSPEGGTLSPGAGRYEVLLTQMADTIVDCLADQ